MMCGGTTDAKDATDEIQGICDKIRVALQEKVGRVFTSYKAKTYKTQLVAGTNFFVKIEVDGGSEHIHARIFRHLPHMGDAVELHSHQDKKTADDDLAYF